MIACSMLFIIVSLSVSAASPSYTLSPFLSTCTRSAIANTSSSLCEIYITPLPSPRSLRIMVMQLHHPGNEAFPITLHGNPVIGPSPVMCKTVGVVPKEMTTAEVEAMVKNYVKAAVIAKTAGFDGVEIHAAHGYLVNQFMSEKIVQLNEEVIKGQIKELVRGSVEETLNGLLEAEASSLTQAAKYERSEERQGYRSGHYSRNLTTTSGDVTLNVPRLKGISFETAIIERYRRRESSVEEALIEMYLAGVSVRRVEDITEALWGSKVSPSTISELNKKAYVHIEDWRNRPLQGGRYPYVYVDGIYLRRNWGGEYENVAILVAIAVNEDGYREVLGAAEGMASLKPLPALKAGVLEAAILISLPVWGLRPVRAALLRTSKVPKPTSVTLSPFFRVISTVLVNALRAASASFLDRLASLAIASTSSVLFIIQYSFFQLARCFGLTVGIFYLVA